MKERKQLMKLIFIYGPPAAGKLTVSRHLSKLTGYKIFHNQVTVDTVASVLDFEHPRFWNLVGKYRLELLGMAAEAGVEGVIHTMCYAHPTDLKFIRKIESSVRKHGGKVHFVHLTCERKALLKRVKNPSRKPYFKLKEAGKLREVMDNMDFFTPIPGSRSLSIDNTRFPAKRAAGLIKTHFKLARIRGAGGKAK